MAKGPLEGLSETALASVAQWGLQAVKAGEAFNVQPGGNSALWFKLTLRKRGAYIMYVGSEGARTTINAAGNSAFAALSKRQTASLLSQAGEFPMHLVGQVRGEKQLVGIIRVLPEPGPAKANEGR